MTSYAKRHLRYDNNNVSSTVLFDRHHLPVGHPVHDSPPPSPMSVAGSEDASSSDDEGSCYTINNNNVNNRFVNRKPAFPTLYHARLQPMAAYAELPVTCAVVPAPASAQTDARLQQRFSDLLESTLASSASCSELSSFLSAHAASVDVNAYDAEGRTPLQRCVAAGRADALRAVRAAGADPGLTSSGGFSLLHLAVFSGNADIIDEVVKMA